MVLEKKLNDLDYCYTTRQLLEQLEKVAYARNEQLRNFQEKIHSRRAIIAGTLSLVLPTIVWGYLLISKAQIFAKGTFATFGTRLIGLMMVTALLFIIPYLLINAMWRRPSLLLIRKIFEANLKIAALHDIQKIDAQAQAIISKPVFTEPRLSDTFFSVEMLTLLIRYFESGQATFMKEAVYNLNLELKNTGYYASPTTHQTLIQKERDYLADEAKNLDILLEREREN